jgi:hypothetical protein
MLTRFLCLNGEDYYMFDMSLFLKKHTIGKLGTVEKHRESKIIDGSELNCSCVQDWLKTEVICHFNYMNIFHYAHCGKLPNYCCKIGLTVVWTFNNQFYHKLFRFRLTCGKLISINAIEDKYIMCKHKLT